MKAVVSTISLTLMLMAYANAAVAETACYAKVAVHADKSITIDNQTFSDATALNAYVSKLHHDHPHCAMSITLDKGAGIGSLGELIAAMQKAGFEKIGFLTEPANIPSK